MGGGKARKKPTSHPRMRARRKITSGSRDYTPSSDAAPLFLAYFTLAALEASVWSKVRLTGCASSSSCVSLVQKVRENGSRELTNLHIGFFSP